MSAKNDFSKVRGSWTKFDSVKVLAVVYSIETLERFKAKQIQIDEPILRSFLGIKSLKDPLPKYWLEIQDYPQEKRLFALFASLFRNGKVIRLFAEKYSKGEMKGVMKLGSPHSKQETNLRSALIESGAAALIYRKSDSVPYDFSPIFQNPKVGRLFKEVLKERVSRIAKNPTEGEFYAVCEENQFHKALSLTKTQFRNWLEGETDINYSETSANYLDEIRISGFYSIGEIILSGLKDTKEIYLLGENGDGKSLVLMAIYLAFNRHFVSEQTDQESTGKAVDIIRANKGVFLEAVDSNGKTYGAKNTGYLSNLFGYGTHRGRYSTDNAEEYGFMSLFSSEEELTNPNSWLRNQRHLELEKALGQNNMVGENKSLPKSFPTEPLLAMFHDLLERNIEITFKGPDVIFNEKGAQLTFDQLSEGYKSILIFVSDLLKRLQENQPTVNDVKKFKGIVIVDEIDLHLHPKWQKNIVKKLRKLLPEVQFILSTHSPTMIQGASNDAVIYRIYRNTVDGKTKASEPYYRNELNYMMVNTLLTSSLFGLDNSRLDNENQNSDTSETYLLYRINEIISEKLEQEKRDGKEFISDDTIDELIKKAIDQELGKNDQN